MIARNTPNAFVAIQSWSTPHRTHRLLDTGLARPTNSPWARKFGRLVGNTSLLSFCNAKGSMRVRDTGVPGPVRYIPRLCRQGHYFFEYMRGDAYTHISVGVRIIEIPVEIRATAASPWFTKGSLLQDIYRCMCRIKPQIEIIYVALISITSSSCGREHARLQYANAIW